MLVPPESSSAVVVLISSSLSATILVLDQSTVADIARFQAGTQIWSARTEASLNLGGQTLTVEIYV